MIDVYMSIIVASAGPLQPAIQKIIDLQMAKI